MRLQIRITTVRPILVSIFVMVVLALPGQVDAQRLRDFLFNRKKETPIPVVFNRMPTSDQLLQHLKDSSTKFQQLNGNLRIALDNAPKLRGTLQLELPKRLRIKAGVAGLSVVDVGSNDESFWVYSKQKLPNQRPAIFFAKHDEFKTANSAVRQAIPLEPVWLLEGLGMIQFEPDDQLLPPQLTSDGYIQLISIRNNAGELSYRVSLIHAQQGIVLQQALYNSQKQLIAYTNSKDYKSYPEQGISIPLTIEMHLFANGQESTMVVELSDLKFDSLFGDPSHMWSMPQPDGVPAIDLTRQAQLIGR